MTSRIAARHYVGKYASSQIGEMAAALREQMQGPSLCAFAFVSPDYIPHLEELCETIRVDGHVVDVVGCTGAGLIQNNAELENGSGCSILGIGGQDVTLKICELSQRSVEASTGGAFWQMETGVDSPNAWITMLHPLLIEADEWLNDWDQAYRECPTIGGLASGGRDEDSIAVFYNGRQVDGGIAVALEGPLSIVPVVSQGCRPIGEPLTVTKAENNIIYALGSRPAYEALENAFQTLSEDEKSKAQGNLFAGLATNEYVDDFKSGDFLIRNIIGADPSSGAVVIGGVPRIGQTVQYQLRDKTVAHDELKATIDRIDTQKKEILGSLLFTCLGRGEAFFGQKDHDAGVFAEKFGNKPLAGIFSNGEIGPVGHRSCIQAFTASYGIFTNETVSNK